MNKVYTLFNLFSSFILAKNPHEYPVTLQIRIQKFRAHEETYLDLLCLQ